MENKISKLLYYHYENVFLEWIDLTYDNKTHNIWDFVFKNTSFHNLNIAPKFRSNTYCKK